MILGLPFMGKSIQVARPSRGKESKERDFDLQ